MVQRIQLEHFLRKIGLGRENINSRLDGVFGSPQYAKEVSWGMETATAFDLFKMGMNDISNGLKKRDLIFDVNVGYYGKVKADLFVSTCRCLYDIGYDAGAKLKPYEFSGMLIDATLEDIAYNILLYI